MTDLNQLLLQFNYNQNFNYDDFFVSKSNFFAFQLIKKWPRWEKNILNIHGEKFCGKTHLANIFYNKNKGIKIYENQINNEIFKKLKLYENNACPTCETPLDGKFHMDRKAEIQNKAEELPSQIESATIKLKSISDSIESFRSKHSLIQQRFKNSRF